MRKRLIINLLFICIFGISAYAQSYEPLEMKSGGLLGQGNLRFILNWAHLEKEGVDYSVFDFGLDFGIAPLTDLENRIKYISANDSEYEWVGWTEMLKFKLGKTYKGPAYSLGTGIKIPLHKYESLGLIAGLYISGAIKDIDFDFNIGADPIYLIPGKMDDPNPNIESIKIRPNSIIKINLRLGYKFLPFFKLAGGFELDQLLEGKKTTIYKNDTKIEETYPGGAVWFFIIGGRLKPVDYPIVFDGSICLGLSDTDKFYASEDRPFYEWQIKFAVQLQPQSPNAEW